MLNLQKEGVVVAETPKTVTICYPPKHPAVHEVCTATAVQTAGNLDEG